MIKYVILLKLMSEYTNLVYDMYDGIILIMNSTINKLFWPHIT